MIGFLIINYNDAPTTKKLLDNIKDYGCLDKIVVVDNNSTDSSYQDLISYQSDKIAILRRENGRQFGAGINFGLQYLETLGIQYTFVSNSDVEIYAEDDLKKIISGKNKGSILAPVVREHAGLNRGWKVPTNFQLLLLSLPIVYRFFLNWNRYPDSYYNESFIPVEVLSFCFFFVSIPDIKKVGYLDENVFLYFEENIMSCKLGKQGMVLCRDVEVFHNHSVTINKAFKRAHKYLVLSKSKRYFARNYNHAGPISLFLFWVIEKLMFVSLSFIDFVRS